MVLVGGGLLVLVAITVWGQTDERRIEFEILFRDPDRHSDLVEPFIVKIDTEDELAEFFKEHPRTIFAPGRTLPVLDFVDHMLLVIFYAPLPDSSYSMITQRITVHDDVLVVHARKTISEGCGAVTVVSRPVHVVQTERIDLDPELVIDERRVNCR